MARTITVVVADDHALFREMLAATLAHRAEGLEVVADVDDAEQAIRAVDKHRPDILLLDLRLPKKSTKELLEEVRAFSPQTRVVILTGFGDEDNVAMAARGGAVGYVLKRGPLEPLLEALRRVSLGEVWADPNLAVAAHSEFLRIAGGQREGARDLRSQLSRRELDVIRLVADGLSNRSIAEKLAISEKTVTTHLNHIFEKLGVTSRLQAALVYKNQLTGSSEP
jgi:two-component system NarL family response regulator